MKMFFVTLQCPTLLVYFVLLALVYVGYVHRILLVHGTRIMDVSKNGQATHWTFTSDLKKDFFLIHYYNPAPFIKIHRKYAMSCGFKTCRWNNCGITFNKTDAHRSNAIIFDGNYMPPHLNFTRPNGQVWIFAAHEPPTKYNLGGYWWYKNTNYSFNWTMTYNKDNTDIFLPYGEITKRQHSVKRDFESIAMNKNNTVLMIASNCQTPAKRQEYVEELRKYIDVKILGLCGGRKWNCGVHYQHDEQCFQILNTTYRFYLAFENAICHQYFSEKLYENFNYDIIMIARGGERGEMTNIFPNGSFIATESFKTIKKLANFLKSLTVKDYAQLLKQKNNYYSTGYKTVYQRALCDICRRMNFKEKYKKTINDIKQWAYSSKPCLYSSEINDIR